MNLNIIRNYPSVSKTIFKEATNKILVQTPPLITDEKIIQTDFKTQFNLKFDKCLQIINNIDLIIKFNDPDHIFNEHNFYNIIDNIKLIHNECYIDEYDIKTQKLLEFLYSKKSKFIRNKITTECTIIIPLLFDITSNNIYYNLGNNYINLKLNKNYQVLKFNLSLKFNTCITDKKSFPDSIYTLINKVENITKELVFDNNILETPKFYFSHQSHCLIFKFNNESIHKFINNLSLIIIDKNPFRVEEYNIKDLRYNNWKYIGLEPPTDNYFIIPFCKHLLNNYDYKDCSSIPLNIILNLKLQFNLTSEYKNLNKNPVEITVFNIYKNILQTQYHNNGCMFI